jgi:hypothetical protein
MERRDDLAIAGKTLAVTLLTMLPCIVYLFSPIFAGVLGVLWFNLLGGLGSTRVALLFDMDRKAAKIEVVAAQVLAGLVMIGGFYHFVADGL